MAYAIYGSGGFAREVAPLVARSSPTDLDIVFVDDAEQVQTPVNGYQVINFGALSSAEHRHRRVIVAVGDGGVRAKLEARVESAGLMISSVIATTAVVMDDVVIGAGGVLADYVVLTSNIKIGRSFQANLYSYVGHDCVIGDYVTFAPRVNCNGNVHIADGVYIGTGASIIQGTTSEPLIIGEGAIVAMGAVVTKPVPPKSLVAGNPARLVRTVD